MTLIAQQTSQTKEASIKGSILIVDDNPANLGVLFDCLDHAGFNVLVAQDGESALQKVAYRLPDLILLDVMMPGIDGFETCRRLKADPRYQAIPVIFMTALSDAAEKVKGLSAGAVDYITKPFQQEEVLARLDIHLRLQRLTQTLACQNEQLQQEVAERQAAQQALQQVNQDLEHKVAERTQALEDTVAQLQTTLHELQNMQVQVVHTEKMASLGQLVAGVAHEINNPVNFIHGNLMPANDYIQHLLALIQLYQEKYPQPDADIEELIEEHDLDFAVEDLPKLLDSMKVGADRIREIVVALRNFSRTDESEQKAVDVHQGLDSTLMILQNRLKGRGDRPKIEVVTQYAALPQVECCPGPLNQVFMNLLSNAIDALEEAHGVTEARPRITIHTELTPDQQIRIAIADNGLGIPEPVQSKIFDPFFTTKPVGKGTGMGLSISHQIVTERHGGTLVCHSAAGQGTEFVIVLPTQSGG